MSLKDIQNDVEKWISQFDPKYWPPFEMLARLTEETGELAREMNHVFGSKKKKPNEHENSIGQEMSDIIFTVVCIANSQGIDLQQEWEKMMREKQYGRDKDRFARK